MKTNRISEYLHSDRRGKEANSLERDALNDVFLYEALEGLTDVAEDPVRDIEYLLKRLKARRKKPRKMEKKMVWTIAALLVTGFGLWALLSYPLYHQEPEKKGEVSVLAVNSGKEESKQDTGRNSVMFSEAVRQRPEDKIIDQPAVEMKKRVKPALDTVKGHEVFMKENKGSCPFGGYVKFYRYIQDSLRYPEDALLQKLEGDIKLSFFVNKAGRPSHIRVVKWITYSCNREAIRLLCEGPAWNYTGDTSYVVIPFRLKK